MTTTILNQPISDLSAKLADLETDIQEREKALRNLKTLRDGYKEAIFSLRRRGQEIDYGGPVD